ncbi:MAG: maltose alpha-D-glucosyltransferase [Gemmatimonadales bacterium]
MAKSRKADTGGNPLWYKDAVIYEARVRAFYDADGDGIGDFRGLAEKLDYLRDLGVTALWLLPFYPSPLRDDGYDISDYNQVHPDLGTLDDFKHFLREAHKRDIRVITELVINHTSDQHPWFQRARRAPPGSRYRNYYVWSDTPEKYHEARIIFKDFEPSNWSWDPVARAYYWHRFYAHQPDLNFEHPEVRKEVFKALDFWFNLGVDGLRLDAIPYLYEREGTNCENLEETHGFLRELRAHVDQKYSDRMLLAEANQWPEDAVAYLGNGDECHMAFHFPVMPRLFMALQMEDRFPIIDILKQTPEIPATCQWALFLRNHDELTLEMVTDEERDYMYRTFARDTRARINLGIRRRLAPLLGNDRRRIELMNGLLFSLPGTPVLYYGDEIGMGDNFYLGDRNGVRTPMQWSSDRNAGFSRANPQRLYLPVIIDPEYHFEAINVEAQQNSINSIYHWMKRLIAVRRHYQALGRGDIHFLAPRNRKVLAFVRSHEDQHILVVANLSGSVEYVELDLADYKGVVPLEMFGHNTFPPIGELPYLLTIGPHSFYWFLLRRSDQPALPGGRQIPSLRVRGGWEQVFRGATRQALENALPDFLRDRRWFAGKAREIADVTIQDVMPLNGQGGDSVVLLVEVEYEDGTPDTYAVPILFATGALAARLHKDEQSAVIADLEAEGREGPVQGILCDGLIDAIAGQPLLDMISRKRTIKGQSGELVASQTRVFRRVQADHGPPGAPYVLGAEQSNSSVVFGTHYILKVIRRLTEGINPELELGRFFTEKTGFTNVAPLAGAVEYRRPRHEPVTVGILLGFVPNEGDAWRYTLDEVKHYFERAQLRRSHDEEIPVPAGTSLDLARQERPEIAGELIGTYLEKAELLGRRTAEMHLALASDTEDPALSPEPFGTLYQRSLYQSMRNLTARTFGMLRERLARVPPDVGHLARRLVTNEEQVLQAFHAIVAKRIDAVRIRCHGDYHLGQVLHAGRDFIIIDFEGEPARSVTERRLKRSPLRDVAGMLRSFDYAVHTVLYGPAGLGVIRPGEAANLEPMANFWRKWVSAAFLKGYFDTAGDARFIPPKPEQKDLLLRILLLEKAVYELAYELNNRPEWVRIPIRGIRALLKAQT